jgi:YHS domain-containing protein
MKELKSVTKDPICGKPVNEITAINTDRDGKKYYFCSFKCRDRYLAISTGTKQKLQPTHLSTHVP